MPNTPVIVLPVVRVERGANVTPLRKRRRSDVVLPFRSRLERQIDEVCERPCDSEGPEELGK
jgi:hypothetical protein